VLRLVNDFLDLQAMRAIGKIAVDRLPRRRAEQRGTERLEHRNAGLRPGQRPQEDAASDETTTARSSIRCSGECGPSSDRLAKSASVTIIGVVERLTAPGKISAEMTFKANRCPPAESYRNQAWENAN
jgi:hypothetical protein